MTLPQFLWMLAISALPIVELRGALPLALLEHEAWHVGFSAPTVLLEHEIAWYYALPVCIFGNLLPVPFLLRYLDPLARLLSRVGILGRLIEWVFAKTRRRGRLVEKYERIGLILIVAIPLPGTGAWTGVLVAFLLGLDFWKSLISITIGVLIAGVIVTVLTLLGLAGGIIAGTGLLALAVLWLWRRL